METIIYQYFDYSDIAIAFDSVKDAQCVVDGDSLIIAAITEPIFTKSERDKLMRDIALSVKEDFARVVVCLDTDIYYEALTGRASADTLIRKAVSRGNSYEYIRTD